MKHHRASFIAFVFLSLVGCGAAGPAVQEPVRSPTAPGAAPSSSQPVRAATAPATTPASPSGAHANTSSAPPESQSGVDARLAEVAHVHGGAGPWAVAGYRMGSYALHALGLTRGSFDLEVEHFSPREVQYSCIADGAAASTGASLGKLNLSLTETTAPETHTTYRNQATGQTVTLRVTQAFAARFTDVPRAELQHAGRVVMELSDAEIFEVVQ